MIYHLYLSPLYLSLVICSPWFPWYLPYGFPYPLGRWLVDLQQRLLGQPVGRYVGLGGWDNQAVVDAKARHSLLPHQIKHGNSIATASLLLFLLFSPLVLWFSLVFTLLVLG